MYKINYWIVPVAALVPMILGYIWYHAKVLGKPWMEVSGMTEEKMKEGNMAVTYGVSYVFACLAALTLMFMTIHQLGFNSTLADEVGFGEAGSELFVYMQDFFDKYGMKYRTFKHGALHGFIGGAFFALPVIGMIGLFERKGWKYIWINAGFWIVSLTIMGGLVCQFA